MTSRKLTDEQAYVSLRNKFNQRVIKTDGCWIWTGFKIKGYGAINHCGLSLRASHVSIFFDSGVFPERNQLIRHTCDNPQCVNPKHLIPGTVQDNSDDMVERNRQAKGEKVSTAKLSPESVNKIKEFLTMGLRISTISIIMKISRRQIKRIKDNQAWKHLESH